MCTLQYIPYVSIENILFHSSLPRTSLNLRYSIKNIVARAAFNLFYLPLQVWLFFCRFYGSLFLNTLDLPLTSYWLRKPEISKQFFGALAWTGVLSITHSIEKLYHFDSQAGSWTSYGPTSMQYQYKGVPFQILSTRWLNLYSEAVLTYREVFRNSIGLSFFKRKYRWKNVSFIVPILGFQAISVPLLKTYLILTLDRIGAPIGNWCVSNVPRPDVNDVVFMWEDGKSVPVKSNGTGLHLLQYNYLFKKWALKTK